MKRSVFLSLLCILLVACAGPGPALTSELPSASSPTIPIAPPPETITVPTLVPNPTATPDTRLPPERWREWPVVPGVTGRAIETYRRGLTMGLDPQAFSKIGDCQSVRAAFMGYFDLPDRYPPLSADYPNLQGTIDNFAGHFNTDGQAVRGGFNAAAVLSPLWADQKICLAGESPLECELRTNQPIIVIVSLEVWWDGRTPEQYEALMRQILDTILAHGAVPILATKADNVEGDNGLNLATARLAYEYDLPLWNFWAAVQPLPDHGMDLTRADGFHISTEAWNTRSFTGLQTLSSVWRGLLAAVPASAVTRTVALTVTPGAISTLAQTPIPTVTPSPGPTPAGGSNRIVFGLAERRGETYIYPGVYLLDLAARQTRQVFGEGVRFQSASPDGKYLLVSQGSTLYRANIDGADPLIVSQDLFAYGSRSAVWMKDGSIAAILTSGGKAGIALFDAEGAPAGNFPDLQASPIELYPGSNGNRIYWESGSCSASDICTRQGAWVTSLDGSLDRALTGLAGPAISPDGSLLAYAYTVSDLESDLGLAAADGGDPRQIQIPGKLLTSYAWSPSGDVVALVLADISDYSGRSSGNRNFVVGPYDQSMLEYPHSDFLYPRVLWSPDGTQLFWIGTLSRDDRFTIGGSLVERSTKKVIDLREAINQSGTDFLTVTNADWLPVP